MREKINELSLLCSGHNRRRLTSRAWPNLPPPAPPRADLRALVQRPPRVRDAAHAASPRRGAAAALPRLAPRHSHRSRPSLTCPREPRCCSHVLLLKFRAASQLLVLNLPCILWHQRYSRGQNDLSDRTFCKGFILGELLIVYWYISLLLKSAPYCHWNKMDFYEICITFLHFLHLYTSGKKRI